MTEYYLMTYGNIYYHFLELYEMISSGLICMPECDDTWESWIYFCITHFEDSYDKFKFHCPEKKHVNNNFAVLCWSMMSDLYDEWKLKQIDQTLEA